MRISCFWRAKGLSRSAQRDPKIHHSFLLFSSFSIVFFIMEGKAPTKERLMSSMGIVGAIVEEEVDFSSFSSGSSGRMMGRMGRMGATPIRKEGFPQPFHRSEGVKDTDSVPLLGRKASLSRVEPRQGSKRVETSHFGMDQMTKDEILEAQKKLYAQLGSAGVEGILQSGKGKGRVETAESASASESASEVALTPEVIEKKRRLLLTSIRSGHDRWRYDLNGVRMDRVDGLLQGDPDVWEKQEYDGMYFHGSAKDELGTMRDIVDDDDAMQLDALDGAGGADDDVPGYTIAEVCLFARSAVLSQQALGLRVLLGIISHGGAEELTMCMEQHLHRIIQIGLGSKGLIVNSLSLQVMQSIVRTTIQLCGFQSRSWKSLFATSESDENDISDSRLDGTISGLGQDASSIWSVGVLRRLKSNRKESRQSLVDEDDAQSDQQLEEPTQQSGLDDDTMDWKTNICSVFQKIGILRELELVMRRFPSLSPLVLEVIAILLPESPSLASQILHVMITLICMHPLEV
jgi:hypothetical protein